MTSIRSVVFLTYHFPPEVGGIQTRISRYVQNLSKRGIHVRVLVAGHHPRHSPPSEGVLVEAVPGGMRRLPCNILSLTRQVLAGRADVVHVFTGSSTVLGLYALILAKVVGARAVMSAFGREDFVFERTLPRVLLRISTMIADSIDVNSTATGRYLPKDVASKVHVLLGAAEELKARPGSDQDAPVLLFVGRLVQRKGVDDLLRAFATVKPAFPEARLSIVGGGPEMGNLVQLAKQSGIREAVDFKGVLVGHELDEEYARCTALVLPSKNVPSDQANEGLGLALIEASMHGKPLIGTRHGGIPEILENGKNGLLVPPNDPDSLAAALTEVLSQGDRTRAMGREALLMARDRFTWDRATDVLLGSYA